ncbi:MAG: hypothetical protein L3K14_07515 [Thermoplasmata archaeon]|nr:hypothetical protein [Thermoplasmata archaeon]
MLGRPRPPVARLLLGISLVALILGAGAPAVAANGPSGGVAFSLGSDGSLAAGLTTTATNGSALRYAMDGNFGPLVAALPANASTKNALLAAITAAENNPFLAGWFGDHDGRVDAVVDLPHFQNLITNEAKLIPVSTITGVFNVTLDGNKPTSQGLQGVSFSNALGSDASSAPIGVTSNLGATFTWNAAAATHVFELAWNLPSILGNLTTGVPSVNLSFATPNAYTITSATGLNGTRVSNDPLGWGNARVSGEYTPQPGNTVVIHLSQSFPTGDAVIIGAVAVLAGLGLGLILLRRRRRRRNRPLPPAVSDPGVGPSFGSG